MGEEALDRSSRTSHDPRGTLRPGNAHYIAARLRLNGNNWLAVGNAANSYEIWAVDIAGNTFKYRATLSSLGALASIAGSAAGAWSPRLLVALCVDVTLSHIAAADSVVFRRHTLAALPAARLRNSWLYR